MLVLSRKTGDKIAIGNDEMLVVLECSGSRIRLGIEPPPGNSVHRAEILERKREFAIAIQEQLSSAMA